MYEEKAQREIHLESKTVDEIKIRLKVEDQITRVDWLIESACVLFIPRLVRNQIILILLVTPQTVQIFDEKSGDSARRKSNINWKYHFS